MGTQAWRHNIHKIFKRIYDKVAIVCKNMECGSMKYPVVFYSMRRLSLSHKPEIYVHSKPALSYGPHEMYKNIRWNHFAYCKGPLHWHHDSATYSYSKLQTHKWELKMPTTCKDGGRKRKGNKQIRDYSMRTNLNYILLSGSNLWSWIPFYKQQLFTWIQTMLLMTNMLSRCHH